MAYKTQQMIDAIPGTGGIIATIAKRVGCAWHTVEAYIKKYPSVAKAYRDECEAINDMAESTVLKAIKEGDVSTAKWWLANKRRDEFSPKQNVDLTSGGEALTIRVVYDESEG